MDNNVYLFFPIPPERGISFRRNTFVSFVRAINEYKNSINSLKSGYNYDSNILRKDIEKVLNEGNTTYVQANKIKFGLIRKIKVSDSNFEDYIYTILDDKTSFSSLDFGKLYEKKLKLGVYLQNPETKIPKKDVLKEDLEKLGGAAYKIEKGVYCYATPFPILTPRAETLPPVGKSESVSQNSNNESSYETLSERRARRAAERRQAPRYGHPENWMRIAEGVFSRGTRAWRGDPAHGVPSRGRRGYDTRRRRSHSSRSRSRGRTRRRNRPY